MKNKAKKKENKKKKKMEICKTMDARARYARIENICWRWLLHRRYFFASVCLYSCLRLPMRKGQVHKLNYRELLPTTQENLNKLIRFICYRLSDHFKSMKCLVWNINYTAGCTMGSTGDYAVLWLLAPNTSFCTICGRRRLNKQNKNNEILLTATFPSYLPSVPLF